MEQYNTIVNQNLGWIHENKYVLPVVSLFLGMYVALARPKLPSFIAKLFENPVFRLVVIAYIIYRGNKDPRLSLMIAAAFLITMHMINKQQVESLSGDCDTDADGNIIFCNKQQQDDNCGGTDADGNIIFCNKPQTIESLSSVGNQDGCTGTDPDGNPLLCNKPRQDCPTTDTDGNIVYCNKPQKIESLSSVGFKPLQDCPTTDTDGNIVYCNKPRQDCPTTDTDGNIVYCNKPRQDCPTTDTDGNIVYCNKPR